jgi:hypothetical protein
MTVPPPPVHPRTGRLRLAALMVMQAAAFLSLTALTVAASRRGDQLAAAGIGTVLAVVFSVLLWLQYREDRYIRKLCAADRQRVDAGGVQNMTMAQRQQWLDDLSDALR